MKIKIILFLLFFSISTSTAFAWFVGPYTGHVVDNQTGKPIEGASVLIYWRRSVFLEPDYDFVKAKLVYTDKDGKYSIFTYLNTGFGLLDNAQFMVYQPGYRYFRNYILYGGFRGHQEFQKKDYLIKLERIPPNFDHDKQYYEMDSSFNGWGMSEFPKIVPLFHVARPAEDVEKSEFLRRAHWEERRGAAEKFGTDLNGGDY